MKSAVGWNVRGIGTDARETAREAARRAGVSVGEWLNTVIADAAGDDSPGSYRGERREETGFSAIHGHLDELAARLGRTSLGSRSGSRNEAGEDLAGLEAWLSGLSKELARCSEETPQRVAEAINRLNGRIESLIASGSTVAREFQRRVADVDDALEDFDDEPGRAKFPRRSSEDSRAEIRARQRRLDEARMSRRHAEEFDEDDLPPRASTRASEESRAEIRARQRRLDETRMSRRRVEEFDEDDELPPRVTARTANLERQLSTLTRQLETMKKPYEFDAAVSALRADLGRIGDALSQAMPRCALDALEAQVQALGDRVDRGRERGADAAALASIEQRLSKLNDLLSRMTPAENIGGLQAAMDALADKVDALSSGQPNTAALRHIETAVVELRRITERVASGDALAGLAGEVRTLAERMDRFSAETDRNDGISALERRLEELSRSVEHRVTELSRSVDARSAETDAGTARLEAMIGKLMGELQRIDAGHHNQAALDHIAGQIGALAARVSASDSRLDSIEMIERGVADLFMQIEDARTNVPDTTHVQRDLADLRLTQAESDRRLQEMLRSVHDGIDRLAERLVTIETSRRAAEQAPAPAVAPARAPVAPPVMPPAVISPVLVEVAPLPPAVIAAPPSPPPRPQVPPPPVAPPVQVSRPAAPPAPPIRPAIDPSLPADHPLEPGSAGRSRVATPAERIAASEAVLAPLKTNSTAEAGEKANFIAAARRAAQAAAAEGPNAGVKGAVGTPEAAANDESGETFSRFKRPLFMSIAAGVMVVGATHVALTTLNNGSFYDTRQVASTVPARVESAKIEAAPAAPAAKPAAPGGIQLFDPNAVTSSTAGHTPLAPQDVAANNARGDVTGSLPKAGDNAALGVPGAPAGADSLPASIGTQGLRAAAAAGQPAAQYEIGIRYAEGRGVAQNFVESARWLEKAAAQGLAPAQYRLGSFYEKGTGVKKDLEAARRLYTASADKGNARAMHNLAVLHAEGIDGKPEYKIAFNWFRKAAGHGIADSQYNLGILFARGIGVEQNLAESYKWFALAAQQGDQDAGRKRDDVAGRLDAQSLVAAKLAAQTFTIDPQPEEATIVKVPPGGWDQPVSAGTPEPTPSKRKPAQRI